MICTSLFCNEQATTIIQISGSPYRGRARCDKCLSEHKAHNDNPERPDMYTGRFVYSPITEQDVNKHTYRPTQ